MEMCIYSHDEFFAESVRNVFEEMSSGYPFLMYDIPVLITSGMTLSEIIERFGKGFPGTEKCVVICSSACERMLSGTPGYRTALFINSKASVSELKAALFRYGRLKFPGTRSARKDFGLSRLNCCIVNDFLKGETVDSISLRYNISPKGTYRHIELSMFKTGVKTRQEFYYKWLLIFSDEEQISELAEENNSSSGIHERDEHIFFSIVSA